jgi:hypothetical protein
MGKRIPTEPGTFLVWRPDLGEDEAEATQVVAWDAKTAAVQYASRTHGSRGFEWTWPVTFAVKDCGTGKFYKVVVEREIVPEFYAPEDAKEWT